jgi:8-oxo-dGTP pyrophosphatase MutT (NUDIX family)
MSDFAESYVGKLRAQVGKRLLMVPGTRVFIENEHGQLLMQHRRDFDNWGFLGGNVEEGESLPDCVVREVKEEVGIEISNLVPIAFSSDPALETLRYPNGDLCQFYVLMFWTRTWHGEPRVLDEESLDINWFGPDNFPPMLKTMKAGLDAFRRYRATGAFQVL